MSFLKKLEEEEKRPYYYSPTPRFAFNTLEEKREFKRRARERLRQELGYTKDIDFLRDVYIVFVDGGVERLVNFLLERKKLYSGGSGD